MLNFKDWLLIEAKTEKIIVYHGTSPRNFNSIMSQGLIPKPKNRAWKDDPYAGFNVSSRQSLEGVYVTSNLMTAVSAATNGANRETMKDGKIIVVAEIQPKTGFADEDDLNRFNLASSHEYQVRTLYHAITGVAFSKNSEENEYAKEAHKKDFEHFYEKYEKEFFKYIKNKLSKFDQNLEIRLKPLIKELFVAAIRRQSAYVSDRILLSNAIGVKRPDAATEERNFLSVKEQITKTLKSFANPLLLSDDSFFTSRIMQPIGFSGANKIICIVYEPHDHNEPPKVLYGKAPQKLVDDWRKSGLDQSEALKEQS